MRETVPGTSNWNGVRLSKESFSGFEQLEVYRRGFAMMKPVYELAKGLPYHERRDLADQMRRACKSMPANIAEGYARRTTPKEFCRYLSLAIGSANEMEVHIATARVLGYVDDAEGENYLKEDRIIGKQLTRLIQYWRTRDAY